jgi:acyl-CoA reductase-like NAD-dependent aldehyde dehydrogenase
MGPQALAIQFDKVLSYLETGVSEGATLSVGGKAASVPGLELGYFVQPTVFTDVRNEMRIVQEEIFGPVLGVTRSTDEADMQQANDSTYGLGGGIWTQNLTRAHRLARGLVTGSGSIATITSNRRGRSPVTSRAALA